MTVTFDLESMAEDPQATSPPELEMDDVGAECEIGASYASVDSPSVAVLDSLTKRSHMREEICMSPYSSRSSPPPEKPPGTPSVDATNDLLSQGLDAYDEPPCDEGVIVDGLVNLTPMGDDGHHDSTGESYYSDSILDSTRESEGEDSPMVSLVPAAVLLQGDESNDAMDLSTTDGETENKTRPANIGVCTFSGISSECDKVELVNEESAPIEDAHMDSTLDVQCDIATMDVSKTNAICNVPVETSEMEIIAESCALSNGKNSTGDEFSPADVKQDNNFIQDTVTPVKATVSQSETQNTIGNPELLAANDNPVPACLTKTSETESESAATCTEDNSNQHQETSNSVLDMECDNSAPGMDTVPCIVDTSDKIDASHDSSHRVLETGDSSEDASIKESAPNSIVEGQDIHSENAVVSSVPDDPGGTGYVNELRCEVGESDTEVKDSKSANTPNSRVCSVADDGAKPLEIDKEGTIGNKSADQLEIHQESTSNESQSGSSSFLSFCDVPKSDTSTSVEKRTSLPENDDLLNTDTSEQKLSPNMVAGGDVNQTVSEIENINQVGGETRGCLDEMEILPGSANRHVTENTIIPKDNNSPDPKVDNEAIFPIGSALHDVVEDHMGLSSIDVPLSPLKDSIASPIATDDLSSGGSTVTVSSSESCALTDVMSALSQTPVETTESTMPSVSSHSPEIITVNGYPSTGEHEAANEASCDTQFHHSMDTHSPADETERTESEPTQMVDVSTICSELVEKTVVSCSDEPGQGASDTNACTAANTSSMTSSLDSCKIVNVTSLKDVPSPAGGPHPSAPSVPSDEDIPKLCTVDARQTVHDSLPGVCVPSGETKCPPASIPTSYMAGSVTGTCQNMQSNVHPVAPSIVSGPVASLPPPICSVSTPITPLAQAPHNMHFPMIIGAPPDSALFRPDASGNCPKIVSITPCSPTVSPIAKCLYTSSANTSPVASRKRSFEGDNGQLNVNPYTTILKLSPIPKPVPTYPILKTSAEFTLPDLYTINTSDSDEKHGRDMPAKSYGISSDINRNFKYLQKLSDEAVAEKTQSIGITKRGRGRPPKSQETRLGFSSKTFGARKVRKPGFSELLKEQSVSDDSPERQGNVNDSVTGDKASGSLSKPETVLESTKKVKTHSSDCNLSLRDQMVRTAIEAKHVHEQQQNKDLVEESNRASMTSKSHLKHGTEPAPGSLKLMIKVQNNKHSGQKKEYFVQRKCTLNVKYDESSLEKHSIPGVAGDNPNRRIVHHSQEQEGIDSTNDTHQHKSQQHSSGAKVHNQRLVRFVVHGGRCSLMTSSSSTFKQRSRLSMLKTQVPMDISKKQFLQQIFHSRPIVKLEPMKRKRSKRELLQRQYSKYGKPISKSTLAQKTLYNGSGKVSKSHLNDGMQHHRKPVIAFPSVIPGTDPRLSDHSGSRGHVHRASLEAQSPEERTASHFNDASEYPISSVANNGAQWDNVRNMHSKSNLTSRDTANNLTRHRDYLPHPTAPKLRHEIGAGSDFTSSQEDDDLSPLPESRAGRRFTVGDASPIHFEDGPPKLTNMREPGDSSQSTSEEEVTHHISPVMPILDKECSISSPGSPDMTVTSKRFPVVVLHKFDNCKKQPCNGNANKRKLLFDTFAQELSVGRPDAMEMFHSSPKPKKQREMQDVFGSPDQVPPIPVHRQADDGLYRYRPIRDYKPSYECTLLPSDRDTTIQEVLDEMVSCIQQQEENDARAANGDMQQDSDSMQLVIGNVVSLQGQDTAHLWDSPLPNRQSYSSTSEYEYEHSGDSCDSFLLQGRKRFGPSNKPKSLDNNKMDTPAKSLASSNPNIQSDLHDRKSRLESMCDKTVKTLKLRLKPLQLPPPLRTKSSAIPTKPCSVVLENTCVETAKIGAATIGIDKDQMDSGIPQGASSSLVAPVVQTATPIKRTYKMREKKKKRKTKDTRPFVKSGTLLYKRRHSRRKRKPRRVPDAIKTISGRPKRKAAQKNSHRNSSENEDNDDLPTIEPLKKKPRPVSLLEIGQYTPHCVIENNQRVPIIPLESLHYSTNEDQQVDEESDKVNQGVEQGAITRTASAEDGADHGGEVNSRDASSSAVNIGLGEELHKAEYTPESGYKTREDEGNSAPEAADDSQSSAGEPEMAKEAEIQHRPEETANGSEVTATTTAENNAGEQTVAQGAATLSKEDSETSLVPIGPDVSMEDTTVAEKSVISANDSDCVKEGTGSENVKPDLCLYGQSLPSSITDNQTAEPRTDNSVENRSTVNTVGDTHIEESSCATVTETCSQTTEETDICRRTNIRLGLEKLPEIISSSEEHNKIIAFAEKTAVAILCNIEHDLDTAQDTVMSEENVTSIPTNVVVSGQTSAHQGAKITDSTASTPSSNLTSQTIRQSTVGEHTAETHGNMPAQSIGELSEFAGPSVSDTAYAVTPPQDVLSPLKSPTTPSKDEPSDLRPPATPGPDILNEWEPQNTPCNIDDYNIRSPESTIDFPALWQSPATPCMDELTVCKTPKPVVIPRSPMRSPVPYLPRGTPSTSDETAQKEGDSEPPHAANNSISDDQKVPTQTDEAEVPCMSPSASESRTSESQTVAGYKPSLSENCTFSRESAENANANSEIQPSNSLGDDADVGTSESALGAGTGDTDLPEPKGPDLPVGASELKLDLHTAISYISPPQLPKDLLTKSSPIEGPTGLATLANVASLVIRGKPKKQSRPDSSPPSQDNQSTDPGAARQELTNSEGSRRSSRDDSAGRSPTSGKPNWTVRRGSKSNSIVIRKIGETTPEVCEESNYPTILSPCGSDNSGDDVCNSGAFEGNDTSDLMPRILNSPNQESHSAASSGQNAENQGPSDILDAKKDAAVKEVPDDAPPGFHKTLSMPTDFDDPCPTQIAAQKRETVKGAGVDIQMELALSDDASSSSSEEPMEDDMKSSYDPTNDANQMKAVAKEDTDDSNEPSPEAHKIVVAPSVVGSVESPQQVPSTPMSSHGTEPSKSAPEDSALDHSECSVTPVRDPSDDSERDHIDPADSRTSQPPNATTSSSDMTDVLKSDLLISTTQDAVAVPDVSGIVMDVLSSAMADQTAQDAEKKEEPKEGDRPNVEAEGAKSEDEQRKSESPEPDPEEVLDNAIRSIDLNIGNEVTPNATTEEEGNAPEPLPVQTVTILNPTPAVSREMDGEISLAVQKIAAECSQMELEDGAAAGATAESEDHMETSSRRVTIPPSPIHPTSPPAPEPPVDAVTAAGQSEKDPTDVETTSPSNEQSSEDSFAPPRITVPACMQSILDKAQPKRDEYSNMAVEQLDTQEELCKTDMKCIQDWIDAFEKMKIPFVTKLDQLRQSVQWVGFARNRHVERMVPRKYTLRKKKPKAEKKTPKKSYIKEHKVQEPKKAAASKTPAVPRIVSGKLGPATTLRKHLTSKPDPLAHRPVDDRYTTGKNTQSSLPQVHSDPKPTGFSSHTGMLPHTHTPATEQNNPGNHKPVSKGADQHSVPRSMAPPTMTLVPSASISQMGQTSASWPHVVAITPIGQDNPHGDSSGNVNRDKTPMVPVSCMVSMPSMSADYQVITGHGMMEGHHHPITTQAGPSDGSIMTQVVPMMHSTEDKQHLPPADPRRLQSMHTMQFAPRDNASNPTHYQKIIEASSRADDQCQDTLQQALMLSDVIDELQPATPQQMGSGMLSPGVVNNKPTSVIAGAGVNVLCMPSNSHSMPQSSMSSSLSSMSSNRPLPPDFNPLYPNTFRSETPVSHIEEHSRTVVHEQSPRNMMTDHSPRHIVHDQSPRNMVHELSPRNPVLDQSPRNMMLDQSPRTVMHDQSPRNNLRDQSPRNMHEQSPRNMAQEQSPRNVVHEHSPRNMVQENFPNPSTAYHEKVCENFSDSPKTNPYGEMHMAMSNRKPRETKPKQRGFIGKPVNAEPPMMMPQPKPTKVIGSANPMAVMHEAFDNRLLEAHQGERKSSLSSLTEYRIERPNKSAFSAKNEPKKSQAQAPSKQPVFSPPCQPLEAPTAHSKKKPEFSPYAQMRPVLAHNRALYRPMEPHFRGQGQYPGYPFEPFPPPPHLVSQQQQYSQLYGSGVPQGDLRSHPSTSQPSMMTSQTPISQPSSSIQPHNYKTMSSSDRPSSPSQHPMYPQAAPHPAYPTNRFPTAHGDYGLPTNMPPIPPAHSGYPTGFQHIMAPKPDHMGGLRHNMADQGALSAMNPFQHNVFPQQQQYNKPSVSVETHASASSTNSPQSKESLPTECAVCHKEVSYLCARCRKQGYCSRQCQNVAWATHGYNCFPK